MVVDTHDVFAGYGGALRGVLFNRPPLRCIILPSGRPDADRQPLFPRLPTHSLKLPLKKVVTGAGFPEPRRVRLLLSEDLSHYLSAAGQQPLASSSAPLSPSPRAGLVDQARSGVDQAMPSPKREVGESKSADKRRKSDSGSSSGEKGASALKVRGS